MSLKFFLLLAYLGSTGFGQNFRSRRRLAKYYVSHLNDKLTHMRALLECMLQGMSPITERDLDDQALMEALEPSFHDYTEGSGPEFWVAKESVKNTEQFMKDLMTMGGYMSDESSITLNNEGHTYVCYKIKLTSWGLQVFETACAQDLLYVCKRYAYRSQRQDRPVVMRDELFKLDELNDGPSKQQVKALDNLNQMYQDGVNFFNSIFAFLWHNLMFGVNKRKGVTSFHL